MLIRAGANDGTVFPNDVVGRAGIRMRRRAPRDVYWTATNVGPAYFFNRRSTFSRTISGSTTGLAR